MCIRDRLKAQLGDQGAQEDVEDRGQEDAEAGHADHAGKNGHAHGMAHFGAGAGGKDQRHGAGDEGDGSHQNLSLIHI